MLRRLTSVFLFGVALAVQAALGQTIADPGFEQPAQGSGKFTYQSTGSAWAFVSSSGLSGNASGFTGGNPSAPQGSQVAILQGGGSISQTITAWPAGSYQVAVQAAQRNWGLPPTQQVVKVMVGGQPAGTITPSSTDYRYYYSSPVTVGAGDHTVVFAGGVTSGDATAFLDSVAILPAGTIVAQATAQPWVATSGKMVGLSFAAITSGKPTVVTRISPRPVLSVNGQVLGPLGLPWLTGYHSVALFCTPGNYQIRPGDAVRITATGAWCDTVAGACQTLLSAPVENRAGKPQIATEGVARSLRLGVNNPQAPTSVGLGFYWPFQNIKYKVGWPPTNRGKLAAPPWTQDITNNGMRNGIDGTAYPGVAGQWLVMWDNLTPAAPVQFAISTSTPTLATVTERADLASTPPGGVGCCRVFDVQPAAAGSSFAVSLSYVDPAWAGKANYDNLWVCQPGDWDVVDGRVSLDRSDPLALSRLYLDRVGPNVGSMRWVDSTACGGNPASVPYPELLPQVSDENWGDLSFVRSVIGYTSVGPVDTQATPWVYSPFFRQAGQSYPATLAVAVTTAPASGTREVWTISDGATAPLMAGLEITIDQEVCRILGGSGDQWTVYRGSNGTSSAVHEAGQVSVSGRRPITDVMPATGVMPRALVVQCTTQLPHGRTTGNAFSFDGSGWPTLTYTDGSTWCLQGFARQCYVTGPNTLCLAIASGGAGGVPTQTVALDPTRVYWDSRTSGGIPYEAIAVATGRFPKADLHINVPVDACDDMVREIARRILASFPSGRRVYVEYGNEPWNWAFAGFYYHTGMMGPLVVPGNPYKLAHYAYRAGQVHAIFRSVFGVSGRAGEIQGLVNCQMGSGADQVKPYLEYGLAQGNPFDCVAVAPYWSMEGTAYNQQVVAKLDDDQLLDVLGADLKYNPRTGNAWMRSVTSALAAYNQAHGLACRLYGYEGGIEYADPRVLPSPNIPYADQRNRDAQYNPLMYHVETDWIAWCQGWGFERMNVYGLAQWWNPQGWGGYHTSQQRHSRGDGLNGAARNLDYRANPTAKAYKGGGMSLDAHVDAVRPQAWQDWLGTLVPATQ